MMKKKRVKRGLLSSEGKPRTVQQRPSVDDFRELPQRKRDARACAIELGHDLGAWHRRKNDPYGRWNAFCRSCNMIAVVAVEAPDYLADPCYGHALTKECK